MLLKIEQIKIPIVVLLTKKSFERQIVGYSVLIINVDSALTYIYSRGRNTSATLFDWSINGEKTK